MEVNIKYFVHIVPNHIHSDENAATNTIICLIETPCTENRSNIDNCQFHENRLITEPSLFSFLINSSLTMKHD